MWCILKEIKEKIENKIRNNKPEIVRINKVFLQVNWEEHLEMKSIISKIRKSVS